MIQPEVWSWPGCQFSHNLAKIDRQSRKIKIFQIKNIYYNRYSGKPSTVRMLKYKIHFLTPGSPASH